MITKPKPEKGMLLNLSDTNLTIELELLVPKSSARMRRGSPYARTPITVPARGSFDVATKLKVTPQEACDIIARTSQVTLFKKRGFLEVI